MRKPSRFLSDLRTMTPKQAIAHIWYYYRWWILGAVFLIVFLVAVTPPREARQTVGTCLVEDSLYEESEIFAVAALDAAGLSTDMYYVDLSTLIVSKTAGVPDVATQISIAVAAETADAVICSQPVLEQLLKLEVFLSAEEDGILEITTCFAGEDPVYLCLLKDIDLPQGIFALQHHAKNCMESEF